MREVPHSVPGKGGLGAVWTTVIGASTLGNTSSSRSRIAESKARAIRTGPAWAHSGTCSLRFGPPSSPPRNAANNRIRERSFGSTVGLINSNRRTSVVAAAVTAAA